MTRRERAALVVLETLALFLVVLGLVWAFRSTVAAGYHVGPRSVVAGTIAVAGALLGYFTWLVLGPRYREDN